MPRYCQGVLNVLILLQMKESIDMQKNEEYKQQLLELAAELMSDEGQETVAGYLDEDELDRARIAILGALDRRVLEKGDITESEAKAKYQILGIDPERASRLRQWHQSSS